MDTSALVFKKLDFQGLQTLVAWALEEGWNPGPKDAEVFWVTDPDGFYGYFLEGDLIAGGAIVSYNQEFGFMGLFIVHPAYRNQGIGSQLWQQRRDLLLSRLHPNASIGMDGVLAMQSFYQKGGFEIAFRDERYEKVGVAFPSDPHITGIQEADFPDILHYDHQCFGFSRPQFLKPWLALPENRTFKYVANGQLRGFAVVRKANISFKVGPLFADDASIAKALYQACLNSVIGSKLYLDIPLVNQGAVELVRDFDATYVFECARMYHGEVPEMEVEKVFGITTFELG